MIGLHYLFHVVLCFQVLLINAVKDVASALGDLISATKYASGKSPQDPAMTTLRDSAKVGSSPSPLGVKTGPSSGNVTPDRHTTSLNVGVGFMFAFAPFIL